MPKTVMSDIDPDVKVPAAVKAAAARADQVHNAAYKQDDQNDNNEGDKEAQGEGEGVGDDKNANGADTASSETPPKTETEKVTQEGSQSQGTQERELSAADWEHRYRSMEGRYNRAQQVIESQNDRLARLESTLASMKQAPAPPSDGGDKTPQVFVTEQEIQEYGQDFLDVVGRKAREIASTEISQLKSHISRLESQLGNVGQHVAKDARGRMLDSLYRDVPNWEDVNRDENFLQWLQLPDPYSGAIRHNLLKEAFEQNDSPRVLAFFKGFLAEEAALAPRTEGGPDTLGANPPAQGGEQKSSKVPLETFAAPGRAKSTAASGAPAEKPIITRSQISKFYADVAANKYRGKEAEKDRLEQMIFEAERDGRIR